MPELNVDGHLTHVLTIDVEDYFQVEAFADRIGCDAWDSYPSRVLANTQRALDLFDRFQVRATFFFVGWVADKFPELVREVCDRGHELACHSYWHRAVYKLNPDEFRSDTRRATDAIEQASGIRVLGYRAPSWSITKNCLWALDILGELGFVYDSSIYPIHHDLYGIPGARRFPYIHHLKDGKQLLEYPPATISIGGLRFPAAGGGYLRSFPLAYTQWAFRQYEKKFHESLVVYFHPWELDPEQPRLPGTIKSRVRHYTNLEVMEKKLSVLLRDHHFQPFRDLMAHEKVRDHAMRGGHNKL